MRYTALFVFIILCALPAFSADKAEALSYGATAVCDGRTKVVTQTFSVPVAEEGDVTRKKDGIACRSGLCKDVLKRASKVYGVIGPHIGEGTFYTLVYFVSNEQNVSIDGVVGEVATEVAKVLASRGKLKRVNGELVVSTKPDGLQEKGCGLTQAANPDPENFVEATPPDDPTIKSARPKLKKGPESGDPNPDQFAIEGEAPGKPKKDEGQSGESVQSRPPAKADVCAEIKQLVFRKRVFTQTHAYGSIHSEITAFQLFLVEVGLLQMEPGVDKFGRLGDKTKLVLLAFQKCYGVPQTGDLDVATITKIFGGFAPTTTPKTLRRR